jgi:hypothetical protein
LACDTTQKVANKQLAYTIKRPYRIALNTDEQYAHSQLQLMDTCTLMALDQQFQRLYIISLCDEKVVQSISFADDGPDKIYTTEAFYYHDKDSIFLFSIEASSFQLINLAGQVKDFWRLDNNAYPDTIKSQLANVEVTSFFPIAFTKSDFLYFPFYFDRLEKTLIFNVFPETNAAGFNDRKIMYSYPPIAVYDKQNRL